MKSASRIKLAASSLDTIAPKKIMVRACPGKPGAKRCNTGRRVGEQRRPQVVPATPEHDNAAAERELMAAMQKYKETSGRMFPTWSEVLEVLQDLGYQKRT